MAVDWSELFGFSLPVVEIVMRGTATYWFLFLLFRFVVRRNIGAVGVADILLLVLVADASQNAMAGEYKTVTDGIVLVSTLIFWNMALDWFSFRFPAFRRLAEPSSLRLVKDGRMLMHNMRKEFISEEELRVKLREQGIDSIDKVKAAFLEPDGEVSVIPKSG